MKPSGLQALASCKQEEKHSAGTPEVGLQHEQAEG